MIHVLCAMTSRDGRLRDDVQRPLGESLRQSGVPCEGLIRENHYGVAQARNEVVRDFLAGKWSHLFFVDDDVVVTPAALGKLLDTEADVVGGVYPYMRRCADGVTRPVLSAKVNGEWPRQWFDGVHDAECVGGGCMLIHRNAFERVGFPWFRWPEYLDDDLRLRIESDDLDFCRRVIKGGGRVCVDGAVRCGHLKEIDLRHLIPAEVRACQN